MVTARGPEVLIIGGGPAGAAAAITLASRGRRVRVLERSEFPRDKTCGDALSEAAVDELERLRALDAVTQRPHVWVSERAAILPDGTRISRRSRRPGMIVPRLHLDDALRLRAEEAGAEFVQGVAVRSLKRAGAAIVAESADAEHVAPFAIAADGPYSVAHRMAGRDRPRARGLALSATVYMDGVCWPAGEPVAEHYFSFRLPAGYGWIFPAVDGRCNVGVYQRADAYDRAGISLGHALDDFLAEQAERLGTARQVGRVRSWPLPLFRAPTRRIAAPRLLLAGDAAAFVDPLSGEGIWQALISGRVAAEVVDEALGGFAPPDLDLGRVYWRRCGMRLQAHAAIRLAIQQSMTPIIGRRLYRRKLVRRLLRAGYAAGG